MKKLMIGVLAAILTLGLGASAYVTYAHGNDVSDKNVPNSNVERVQLNEEFRTWMEQQGMNVADMEQFLEQQGIDVDQMYDFMNSGADSDEMWQFMQEYNINFGQMLPYMQKVHPDLNTQDLQELYEDCHGIVGSSNSGFQGMMNSGGM